MGYQSVIAHQAKSKFRAIRSDYLAICDGAKDPVCAALLLDLAEAWTNHKYTKTQDEFLDDVEIHDDLWFYRSEENIKRDLFNAYGINKLRDNRVWLVEVGYLECKQIPRKQGGFTYQYRLNIELVQGKIDALAPVKNNDSLEANHPLKITDAPVKNNDIRDISKENKKIESSNPTLDELALIVKKELKQTASISERIASYMLGLSKGKDKELNLDTPMSKEDFLSMMAWWDLKKDRDGQKLARPSNLGSFRRQALQWQSENKQNQAISQAHKPTPPPVVQVISEEEQTNALDIIAAARQKVVSND